MTRPSAITALILLPAAAHAQGWNWAQENARQQAEMNAQWNAYVQQQNMRRMLDAQTEQMQEFYQQQRNRSPFATGGGAWAR